MAGDLVIRARKFVNNALLNRKQFVLDIYHKETNDISKKTVSAEVAKKFKVDAEQVVIFGTKTKFGGGRSTSFCLIYDSMVSLKKFEPKHRLKKRNLLPEAAIGKNRRTKKEEKNRTKHLRGKAKLSGGKKK